MPADLRDDGHREEQHEFPRDISDGDEALAEDERIEKKDPRRGHVDDERICEERDPLAQATAREEIEARGDPAEEREQVADETRASSGGVREGDHDDAAEAEADPEGHPGVQSFPEDEMGEQSDEERMGGDQDHRRGDAHADSLQLQGAYPQGEMGREDRADPHHAEHLLSRERQQGGPVREDERHQDQGREGEPIQRDRDEGRRGPGDEDGRERHGHDREGDRGVRPARHGAGTSGRLCNGYGTPRLRAAAGARAAALGAARGPAVGGA